MILRCRGGDLSTTLSVDSELATQGALTTMEWTPEAIKAEIDYRQRALREDARYVRVLRSSAPRKRTWWQRLAHRPRPDLPEQGNRHGNAA